MPILAMVVLLGTQVDAIRLHREPQQCDDLGEIDEAKVLDIESLQAQAVAALEESVDYKNFIREALDLVEPTSDYRKFYNAGHYLSSDARFAKYMGLHEGKAHRILDLGTGPAYFPWVANKWGHQADGVDAYCPLGPGHCEHVESLKHISDALGVKVSNYTILPSTPLPDFGNTCRYDLVFARSSWFGHSWDLPQWQYFITDLACNLVTKEGTIFIHTFSHIVETSEFQTWLESMPNATLTTRVHPLSGVFSGEFRINGLEHLHKSCKTEKRALGGHQISPGAVSMNARKLTNPI